MRKIGIYILIYFSTLLFEANAQVIRIGLMDDYLTEAFSFHCLEGSFDLVAEGIKVTELKKGDLIFISVNNGKVLLNNGKGLKGEFSNFLVEQIRAKAGIALLSHFSITSKTVLSLFSK